MNAHITDERLQEYAAGELAGDVRAAVERHLEECSSCRAEAAAIADLLGRLHALRGPIAPPRDLRPGIWQQIDADAATDAPPVIPLDTRHRTPRRVRISQRRWLAAAALLLMLISSSVTWLIVRRTTAGSGGIPPAAAEYQATLERYVAATAELEQFLTEQRSALPPETVSILERNLRVIDEALAETTQALAAEPGNDDLTRMLLATYEKKLGLLRSATRTEVGI